jgi:hypothetical protein
VRRRLARWWGLQGSLDKLLWWLALILLPAGLLLGGLGLLLRWDFLETWLWASIPAGTALCIAFGLSVGAWLDPRRTGTVPAEVARSVGASQFAWLLILPAMFVAFAVREEHPELLPEQAFGLVVPFPVAVGGTLYALALVALLFYRLRKRERERRLQVVAAARSAQRVAAARPDAQPVADVIPNPQADLLATVVEDEERTGAAPEPTGEPELSPGNARPRQDP